MAELADAPDLGSGALRRVGSTPSECISSGGEIGRHKGLKIPRPQGVPVRVRPGACSKHPWCQRLAQETFNLLGLGSNPSGCMNPPVAKW